MSFDYKKEYKEFYLPKNMPTIVEIPKMNYIAIRGYGNPNDKNGEYLKSINLLYAIAYTLKMSKKTDHRIDGYYDYVVPPLEGLWWQEGCNGFDYTNKDITCFISMIRLPDFITKADVDWALKEATSKKKQDFSKVEFFTYNEGLCVQCMHYGHYDDEPKTMNLIDTFLSENNYTDDIDGNRRHHEIYLSDPRKTKPSNLKTVIRRPIRINKKLKNNKENYHDKNMSKLCHANLYR